MVAVCSPRVVELARGIGRGGNRQQWYVVWSRLMVYMVGKVWR